MKGTGSFSAASSSLSAALKAFLGGDDATDRGLSGMNLRVGKGYNRRDMFPLQGLPQGVVYHMPSPGLKMRVSRVTT